MPDDELRELISRQVYGVGTAEADAQRKKREEAERAAAQEVAKDADKDQCGQVFSVEPDRSVCRWYVGFSTGARTDSELRESVNAHLRLMKEDGAVRESTIESIQRLGRDQVRDRIFEKEAEERRATKEREAALEAKKREREAKKREREAALEAKKDAATEPHRKRLADDYQKFLSRLFSSYNYIEVETEKFGNVFFLYGIHPFFSKYTFRIGPQGPLISRWVGERAESLRTARIGHVGVRSDSGDATYYKVP